MEDNINMEPILNEETKILIVGTFPGRKSRELNQYYADSRNQFWKLMGDALDVNFKDLDYNNRIEILHKHKIGLWDTIKSCKINGSSDRNIRDEECNDFSYLIHIKKIICNGKEAEEKYIKCCNVPENIEIVRVPSSSTMNPVTFLNKSEKWKEAMNSPCY